MSFVEQWVIPVVVIAWFAGIYVEHLIKEGRRRKR